MPTQTITQEKTIEEEVELTICSDCSREVDEDGMTLSTNPEIDFCSECLKKYADIEKEPKYVQRTEEWLETEDSAGNTMEIHIKTFIVSSVLSVFFALLTNISPASSLTGLIFFLGGMFLSAFILLKPKYYPE